MRLGQGTWRFFLAFLVVISHLWSDMIHGPSAYAVWAFFVLSGYLMTLVLTTKYGTDAEGVREYAFNRLLRIYPLYAVAFILGLVTLVVLHGFDLSKLNPQFRFPASSTEWVASPNWQIGFTHEMHPQRYVGFATVMFPFAVGSLCCHYEKELRSLAAPVTSVAVWCAFGTLWLIGPYWPWTYGLALSVPLSAWVTVSLARRGSGQIDRWAGDLSYPIYLFHTTIAAWFVPYFGFGRSFTFFVAAFASTLLVSWALVILVDRPAQRLKRPGKAATQRLPVPA
jgi:peptidoglycan/LPS O-acetylase OafA/YrhL